MLPAVTTSRAGVCVTCSGHITCRSVLIEHCYIYVHNFVCTYVCTCAGEKQQQASQCSVEKSSEQVDRYIHTYIHTYMYIHTYIHGETCQCFIQGREDMSVFHTGEGRHASVSYRGGKTC